MFIRSRCYRSLMKSKYNSNIYLEYIGNPYDISIKMISIIRCKGGIRSTIRISIVYI